MMRHQTLEHRIVRNVPRELDPGVLYIFVEYATAVHSCCCGCGDRVVTPFTQTDWRMTFDGEFPTLALRAGRGLPSHAVRFTASVGSAWPQKSPAAQEADTRQRALPIDDAHTHEDCTLHRTMERR